VPLQLTAKERSTLAMILGLLVLGLIGMAVLRETPEDTARASSPQPPAATDRPAQRPRS